MSGLDAGLARRVAAMRREPAKDEAALERLRAAVRAEEVRHRTVRWIMLSPGAAVVAVSVVAALTSLLWMGAGRLVPGGIEGSTPTQFVLRAPDAARVSVVGDFNDWDPDATPMAETGDGVWSVVVPLQPGSIRFSFLIDGREWRADPAAPPAPLDFGRPTSLAFVPEPGGGS